MYLRKVLQIVFKALALNKETTLNHLIVTASLAALLQGCASRSGASNLADDKTVDSTKQLYLGEYVVIDQKCKGHLTEQPCNLSMKKVGLRLNPYEDNSLAIFLLDEKGALMQQINLNSIAERNVGDSTEWALFEISDSRAEHTYEKHTYNWIRSPRQDHTYKTTLVRNESTISLQREGGYRVGYGNPVTDYWNETYELQLVTK